MAKDFFTLSAAQCLKSLKTTKNGLSSAESQSRLSVYGQNILKTSKPKHPLKVFLKQFSDVMTIILLIAAAISMIVAVIGNKPAELVDGFIILGIVLTNAFIGFYQERKAEKSMNELKKLTQPECKVLRNGNVEKIASQNLVIGDIIALESGDIIPADARLIETLGFRCDESALTGESVPAEKDHKCILHAQTPLAEQKNMAFSGTVVTSGRALGVVVATGKSTQIGKIAGMLSEEKNTQTPLQRGIAELAKITTYIVLAICVITFIIELTVGSSTVLEAFLTAVCLAVAAIPESLPAVITIIISLGARRLAKKKAIIKHLHAIETLGCCEVICSDKTGTLTQNKMQVQAIYCGGKTYDYNLFSAPLKEHSKLLEIMLLCESVEPSKNGYIGDPTELALVNFAEKFLQKKKQEFEKNLPLIDEIPFDSTRKLMSSIRQTQFGAEVLTKGAIDELLLKCTHIMLGGQVKPLLPFHKQQILRANKEMANNALRVLGFAYKSINSVNSKSAMEQNLVFVGLCGLFDPPRPEVKKAVEKCKRAKILPIMITGDHKSTAFAVAKKIGISDNIDEVITGTEIDKLSDEKFLKVLQSKKVFARVSPENKVRIVSGFKKLGQLVAMTGDGVNDAPSIKKADIGIGMGQSGTDVTKEVADIIITDDNFATIVLAVQEGRKTFANIQKTIQFLFTANLAEITAIFLATIFFPHLVFLSPVQILFVNLLSDTLPAVALGVEPEEKDLMKYPPRKANKSLLSGGVGINILVMGIVQGLIMLSCFLFGLYVMQDEQIANTMAFYALNIVQFFYFVSMRTNSVIQNPITSNKLAVYAVLVTLLFVLLVAITPLCGVFGLVAIPIECWLFIAFASALTFIINEVLKKLKK